MDATARGGTGIPSSLADATVSERLRGVAVPSLTLASTAGPIDLADLAADVLALFVYPHATGLPDAPVPDWDLIPGARGCTAQACGFRDSLGRLRHLGAAVGGVSVQSVEEQQAFAARVGVDYPLISDPDLRLAAALGFQTFIAGGRSFYRRLTLIARDRRIVKVFSPVLEPERNAIEVASWLERESGAGLG
jgi:peroxiredoxin